MAEPIRKNIHPSAAFMVLAFCLSASAFFWQMTSWAAGATTLQDAEVAYVKGDFAKAQELYSKALADPNLDPKNAGGIKAKIAICRINLEAGTAAASQPAAPALVQGPRTLHAKPRPNEVRTLDIKELGNFEYDPERGGGLPADVLALTGLHVRMTGYMIPLTQANDSITEFALVPSLFSCCFGAPPQIQHTITVHTSPKAPAAFYTDLIAVEGVLKVQEKREDNYTVSLFEIDATSVAPSELKIPVPVMSGKKQAQPDLNSLK